MSLLYASECLASPSPLIALRSCERVGRQLGCAALPVAMRRLRALHHRCPLIGSSVLGIVSAKSLPIASVLFLDIKIAIFYFVGRTLQLHIATGAKVDAFSFGQPQNQLFDEGGDIFV